MKQKMQKLKREYQGILCRYLDGEGESALFSAYELGRQAMVDGLGVLDLAVAHHESLVRILGKQKYSESSRVAEEAVVFCEECLSSFEMVTEGFQEPLAELSRQAIEIVTINQQLRKVIAEQKQTEAVLRETEGQLRQAQKLEAVGSLAGGVAHEFNNLLQAILGYTHYAMEAVSPEDAAHRDLNEIVKAADRATGLTRQLLGFSRRQSLNRRQLESNQLVTDLVEMIRPLIGENINLKIVLKEYVGLIEADEGLLQQVLLNLCVNARDAMPEGGELVVSTDRVVVSDDSLDTPLELQPGTYVVLAVSDTGIGMSSEVKQHLFEPFFTTKEVGKGTGLGLALVYGIVQQHGGTVSVDSEFGQGTTFRIFLPAEALSQRNQSAARSSSEEGGSEGILIAEDESAVRKVLVRLLSQAGYQVFAAADGKEACELFVENADSISLVLLDMVMPKKNGREVLEQITEINPDIKVIFCTGYDPGSSHADTVLEEGFCVIEKPFSPNSLLNIVRKVLDFKPNVVLPKNSGKSKRLLTL